MDLQKADGYFSEAVLHNDPWMKADPESKKRALHQATHILFRYYGLKREISCEAIFEQAFWLLRISEARKTAEQGVTSYTVDGISVALSQIDRTIAPQAMAILGRRVARSRSARTGYLVDAHRDRWVR